MSTEYNLYKDEDYALRVLEHSCKFDISIYENDRDLTVYSLSPVQITKIAQQLLCIASYNADATDIQKWLSEYHYNIGISL